jgi:hypothetical protein
MFFKVALAAGIGDDSTHERVLVTTDAQPTGFFKRLELGVTLFALAVLPSRTAFGLFRTWTPSCVSSPLAKPVMAKLESSDEIVIHRT